MGRADDHSPRARLDPPADLCGVDLILECERAASRRNPRHRDPKRWSKTAWRRYLYTAATHQASWTWSASSGNRTQSKARRPMMDGGLFIAEAQEPLYRRILSSGIS